MEHYKAMGYQFRLLILSGWIVVRVGSAFAADYPDAKNIYLPAEANRGELLFRGIVPLGNHQAACVTCHYLTPSDSVNWNPSAMELGKLASTSTIDDFSAIFTRTTSDIKQVAHKYMALDSSEFVSIHAYLTAFATDTVISAQRKGYSQLALLLISLLIVAWALVDLFYFHWLSNKKILLLGLISTGCFVGVSVIYRSALQVGHRVDFEPEQPIKFSHAIHASDNRIDCKYCHHYAESFAIAGMPSTQTCLNCHRIILEGAKSGRFEINKIFQSEENQQPLEWVRTQYLPEHVRFNHAVHTSAGQSCLECHIGIDVLHRTRSTQEFSMGWCIDCHQSSRVPGSLTKTMHDSIKMNMPASVPDSVFVSSISNNDCQTCHY